MRFEGLLIFRPRKESEWLHGTQLQHDLDCMQQTPMPHLRWLRSRMAAEQVSPRSASQSLHARMLPHLHARSFQATIPPDYTFTLACA